MVDTTKPLAHFDDSAQSYEKNTGGCTRELAERILPFLDDVTADSVVLDNACGSGIVTDVLLRHFSAAPPPRIFATDGAPKMVELVRGRFSGDEGVTAAVMPGEALDVADATFTHSVTSLGLMFFADPAKGAAEIYRTLKPGGTAVVTGWEELGYVPIVREVQREIRPADEPFSYPIGADWFDPAHTERVMRAAGFEDVEMRSELVYWADKTAEEVVSFIAEMFGSIAFKDWDDAEKKRAEGVLTQVVKGSTVDIERDGAKWVGIKMKAIVAVCRK
ncbi:Methyltransferase type 11 [Colletotrichum higginsianum IMI 349063]|uniref:Methyltransferase type 11 n=2 Tax=Colletotrichum higginsianum TaxID=80884 RepID=A0A1B7Y2Y1_COLHI|nr:Methyltransferase type 11 [Colletotrichum higginsianum IMI 349063]OBR06380.1 Methyltransferase type 11 [Colletotrichum higginsianum IMI 349063]TIC97799.1 Glandicoline B O-methyltransferase roqN [Colletotrichum higginsianum]